MQELSEVSRFFVKNWLRIQDLLNSYKIFEEELASILNSLEEHLKGQEWWSEDWVFRNELPHQVYVSRTDWEVGNNHVLWIGLEGFTSKKLFGDDIPPILYVWVNGRKYIELARYLKQRLRPLQNTLIGSVIERDTGYIIKLDYPKCLGEEADQVGKMVLENASAFISFYAEVLLDINSEICNQIAQRVKQDSLRPNNQTQV